MGARPFSPGAAGVTVKDSARLKSSEEKSTSSTLRSIDAAAGVGLKDFCKGSKASAGAALAVKINSDRERHSRRVMERKMEELTLS
mgnify:FL=1